MFSLFYEWENSGQPQSLSTNKNFRELVVRLNNRFIKKTSMKAIVKRSKENCSHHICNYHMCFQLSTATSIDRWGAIFIVQ